MACSSNICLFYVEGQAQGVPTAVLVERASPEGEANLLVCELGQQGGVSAVGAIIETDAADVVIIIV